MNFYLKWILIVSLLIILGIILLIYIPAKEDKTIHQVLFPEYYQDKFMENAFLPDEDNKIDYGRKTDIGTKILRQKRIAILGLAYNLGSDKTHKLMRRLQHLTKLCKDYRIIIYAVDSTDNTYDILKCYQKYNRKIILPTDFINKDGLNRVEKMGKLRNILHKNLLNSGFLPDYVLLHDLDLASALSLDGLCNSCYYLERENYDVIFANGIINEFVLNFHFPFLGYFYYDSFAFREDPNYPIMGGNKAISYGRGEPLIPVQSAFGGAAIYKFNVFRQFKYREKGNICEHVPFHRDMFNEGYKLAINPSFLLISGRQGEENNKKI